MCIQETKKILFLTVNIFFLTVNSLIDMNSSINQVIH